MTVSELIARLNLIDGDRQVIMQSDAEGNNYSPLSDFWLGAYAADTTWFGEAGLEELTAEDIEQGYTDDDVIDGQPAVFLTPVN